MIIRIVQGTDLILEFATQGTAVSMDVCLKNVMTGQELSYDLTDFSSVTDGLATIQIGTADTAAMEPGNWRIDVRYESDVDGFVRAVHEAYPASVREFC